VPAERTTFVTDPSVTQDQTRPRPVEKAPPDPGILTSPFDLSPPGQDPALPPSPPPPQTALVQVQSRHLRGFHRCRASLLTVSTRRFPPLPGHPGCANSARSVQQSTGQPDTPGHFLGGHATGTAKPKVQTATACACCSIPTLGHRDEKCPPHRTLARPLLPSSTLRPSSAPRPLAVTPDASPDDDATPHPSISTLLPTLADTTDRAHHDTSEQTPCEFPPEPRNWQAANVAASPTRGVVC
jgi:hypothetical protein